MCVDMSCASKCVCVCGCVCLNFYFEMYLNLQDVFLRIPSLEMVPSRASRVVHSFPTGTVGTLLAGLGCEPHACAA